MAIPQTHFRSISLPSRLDQTHPINLELELQKIKSCSYTSESIQSGILGLAKLFNSVAQHQDGKSMEESLSHSVHLLDACAAIRELLQMIRENVHVLQSALRRKGTDSAIQNDVAAYFLFRKRMQKTVAKTLKNITKSEMSIIKSESNGSVLSQLMVTAMSILKGVLVFLSPAARRGGWSLVAKLMTAKSERECVNEIANVDMALNQVKMGSHGASGVDLQKTLQIVDAAVEGFEEGLEGLFKQLIRTRVSLLNILTNH